MLAEKLSGAVGNAANPTYIEDVFSTYLYTGNGANQIINNGISLGGGNTSGSVYFPTTSTYLNTSSSISLGTGNFTFECFVNKLDSNTNNNSIFTIDDSLNSTGLQAYIVNNNIRLYNGGGVLLNVALGVTTVINGWTHIAIVKNSGTVNAYVNGVSAGSASLSNSLAGALTIGAQKYNGSVSGAWVGNIASFRLTNTAVYTANFTPPTSLLTAISGTQFLALQGTTPFVDQSSNAYAITQNNSPAASTTGPFATAGIGSGGMVWLKARTSGGSSYTNHAIIDTARGANAYGYYSIYPNLTDGQFSPTGSGDAVATSVNSTGFTVGGNANVNYNTQTDVSWTFRKQTKFFDVVTFTGNNTSSKTIAHNLGSVPGCIIVKATGGADDWFVYHRSWGDNYYFKLNTTDAGSNVSGFWPASPTSTDFTVGSAVNANTTYVAYLFAHNAGGFGLTGTDNVISCGSYTCDGSGNFSVNLGYEPQWIMYKRTDSASSGGWYMVDNMRGLPVVANSTSFLLANSTAAENTLGNTQPTATGFSGGFVAGATCIYIAIRRGPMKVPTDGTTVFKPSTYTGTGATAQITNVGFAPDVLYSPGRGPSGSTDRGWFDRLRGINNVLQTNSAGTEDPTYVGTVTAFNSDGVTLGANYSFVNSSGSNYIQYFLRRAPGFYDAVCETATGDSNKAILHGLGVVPEMIIAKDRTASSTWHVYHKDIGQNNLLGLNSTVAATPYSGGWGTSAFTSTTFYINDTGILANVGDKLIFHLFASCPGVSKVGSIVNTGSTVNVDCGFTAGARFILLKNTSTVSGWYAYDTARGIFAGSDPWMALNTASAEGSASDDIDTYASGFTFNGGAWSNGTYIYLAIA